MQNTLIPLTLAAALGLGSAASALTDTGTIASVDTVSDTVTLTDGAVFAFGDADYADRLASFKPGDAVSITYHHVGTGIEANAISPINAGFGPVIETVEHGVSHLD